MNRITIAFFLILFGASFAFADKQPKEKTHPTDKCPAGYKTVEKKETTVSKTSGGGEVSGGYKGVASAEGNVNHSSETTTTKTSKSCEKID